MSKPTVKWIACHDTLVCTGSKQIQKWCVREGNEKGPLIAVMLTKDVAHALAAAPEMLELCLDAYAVIDVLAKGVGGIATPDGFFDLWNRTGSELERLGGKPFKDRIKALRAREAQP